MMQRQARFVKFPKPKLTEGKKERQRKEEQSNHILGDVPAELVTKAKNK